MTEESLVESGGCVSVRVVDSLGVDGEGEPRVGMSEAGLDRLYIDPCQYQLRCVRPPQVVEAGFRNAGRLHGG